MHALAGMSRGGGVVSQSVLWNVPSQIAAHGNVLVAAQASEVWHGHVSPFSSSWSGVIIKICFGLAHKGSAEGGGSGSGHCDTVK